jgi:hypothetical protein
MRGTGDDPNTKPEVSMHAYVGLLVTTILNQAVHTRGQKCILRCAMSLEVGQFTVSLLVSIFGTRCVHYFFFILRF